MTLRRLSVTLAALLGACLGCGTAATLALASFTSSAPASQTLSSRSLTAPGSLTATPTGHDVALSWTSGANGTGYSVLAAANGTNSNCSTVTYTSLTTTTGLTYADTSRYQPQGTYECYQVRTTYNTWTSQTSNPTAAAQIGFVAQTVTATNGGAVGKLDTGDTIKVTYNQPVNPATGPVTGNRICTNAASTGNIVMVGDAITGCNATTTVTTGTISGGTATKTAAYNITWAWTNTNTTLTITIGTRTSGSQDAAITGTLTFNPTTTVTNTLSATGAYHNCDSNSGGGNCLPTITGSF